MNSRYIFIYIYIYILITNLSVVTLFLFKWPSFTFAHHLQSKATKCLTSFNAIQKAHHCKSFKGGITFLDKALVKKMTTLFKYFVLYVALAHILYDVILALYFLALAYQKDKWGCFPWFELHISENPFGPWTARFCWAFQKHIPVSSLIPSIWARLLISRVFAVTINVLWMHLSCCSFSCLVTLSISDGSICWH